MQNHRLRYLLFHYKKISLFWLLSFLVTVLKCPYDQIFDFHVFTFSCTIRPSYSSCQISIHYEHQKSFYFNIYFREFTAAINQPCSKAWLRMGESDVQRLKHTSWVEIIITSIENHAKSNKSFGLVLCAIFYADCYYNFNPWGMFESLTSLSPICNPSLGTRLINGGRKLSEINVEIKWLLMFVMDWNLARWEV